MSICSSKAENRSDVDETDETRRSGRTCRNWVSCGRSGPRKPGMYSSWTKVSLRNTERCSNHDNVREQLENLTQKRSRGDTIWKVTRKSASNDFANWRKKDSGVVSSLNSLFGRPQLGEGRIGNGWRLVQSVLSNCLKMLVLGQNWLTWYTLVRKQTCTSSHKMNESLWRTLSSFDFIHSPHQWLPTKMSCGQYGSALSIGSIPRLRFCWRSWRL